ncbi:MAG: DUF2802 domain-containing protein [Kangiellaceae bacterium]|jgi:hypothetical protein|nr:DUF2802 domain-containing protein [Kangiellaceae bacterium]
MISYIVPSLFLLTWLVAGLVMLKQRCSLKNLNEQLALLKREQSAILSGNNGLGRRLFQVKSSLNELERSQDELMQAGFSDKSFEQASKLLTQGNSIEDVMKSCHLSLGEAELLQQMLKSSSVH